MPSYYDDEEETQEGPASPVGENPAASWISRVEDPNSVVSQYGTEYSGSEAPVASARGTVQRPVRNVDQWGNESPTPSRTAKTLSSVYRTISAWKQYLTGGGSPYASEPGEKQQFTIPSQYKGANARTIADIVSQGRSVSIK